MKSKFSKARLFRIAARLRLPIRKQDRAIQIEMSIRQYLDSARVWKAIIYGSKK